MLSVCPARSLRNTLVIGLSLLTASGVLASGSTAECPDADPAALQWLDKMSHSLREVSYEGVVTLQRGEDTQSLQVSHSVGEGHSSERLTELTGQGAQVERGAHSVDCVHPGYQMLRMASFAESDHCGIAEQYRFIILDHELVAGRTAVRIRIDPRDMYRFGYVIALDSETGLLLKAQTVSHAHQTLETMQFAQLSYTGDVSPVGPVAVVHEAEHPQVESESSKAPLRRGWSVGWLPRGFAPTDSPAKTDRRRTFTDGLAVFSVFLEDLDRNIPPGEGMVTHGGTTTFTRGRLVEGWPVLVTVIGEVPVNTARLVAESVRWVQ